MFFLHDDGVGVDTLKCPYLHRYWDEPFLPKGPPQQSRGCEGSDDAATLPRVTQFAMTNDPPHTTPQPLL